jgi:hypothetical protein
MDRGAAGVPTGSVSNARRCRRARCRVRRACRRVCRARCRVNGRPARHLAGRQHGPGDDDPAPARALAREVLIAAVSASVPPSRTSVPR